MADGITGRDVLAEAQEYATSLSLNGRNDWGLLTASELETLQG